MSARSEKPGEAPASSPANAVVPATSYAIAPSTPRQAGHPKRSTGRRWGLWIGLAAAAGVGSWLGYAQPWRAGPTSVAVEIVAPGPITRVLAVNGRIAALHAVNVTSTVPGTLTAQLAAEGDVVAQGAVLAQLDDTSQRAAVRQATAALEQGRVAQAQARAALDRAASLAGAVPRVTLEDAQRAMERAEQEVGRLSALVDQAQFQLTKFTIVAPIAGTVLTRGVEPGQVIDLNTRLFTLADLRDLVVETTVDESYATQIRPDMPAVMQLTGDTRPLDGTVIFVAPVVDADTGGLAIKIAFAEPQTAPVGLTVTANIIVERLDAAISAPRAAVVASPSGRSVFVLEDGKAKRTPIAVADWPADRLVVSEGLQAGDLLITDAGGLADGESVDVAGP
ncbi:MAG: efflux RND transporter periplasmic adaptor subunit [Microvirga sp.]|nr:efflux RND transporter periplasmic adaptor subunit [Microvirga sp.]